MNRVAATFFFLLCGTVLGAKEQEISPQIEANIVDYDGKKICLSGDVKIDHTFGKLQCEKAVVLMSCNGDKNVPGRILLAGAVHVLLRDGATIDSQEADLDCKTLEAVFTSSLPEKVIYTMVPNASVSKTPMRASSRAMRVKMKKDQVGGSSKYVVSDIHGEDTVTIDCTSAYSNKFLVVFDSGCRRASTT